jgi:hypothetical protein
VRELWHLSISWLFVPKEKVPLWKISGKNFKHDEKYGVSVFRRKAVKQKPDPDFSFRMSEVFLYGNFPRRKNSNAKGVG